MSDHLWLLLHVNLACFANDQLCACSFCAPLTVINYVDDRSWLLGATLKLVISETTEDDPTCFAPKAVLALTFSFAYCDLVTVIN